MELGNDWRPFGIARMVDESCELRSFFLTPLDETGLAEFHAGQYLPVRIKQRGRDEYFLRNFWLSSAPSDGVYRISVKRDGKMATLLHSTNQLESLEVGTPAGAFMIDATDSKPAVLIAEGIGVSPFISMLRNVVHEGLRGDRMRPVWLVYCATSTSDRAFDEELASLVVAGRGTIRVTRVLTDITDASENEYELSGEVDAELLRMVLPFSGFRLDGGHDFYLSGSDEFVSRRRVDLLAMSVPIGYIHTELQIGPATAGPTKKSEETCKKDKI
jgi:ferredoxin-NADP reductase